MSHIHIHRDHHLGHAGARKVAYKWAEQVETEFGMDCTYEEGHAHDEVRFKRSGVSGTLKVTPHSFELDAKLGFLLGAFRDRIEGEIVKNLDALLAKKPAARKPKA
jgi:putative polyhydroxyalkanoate system protein